MRRRGKLDANQRAVVAALEERGWSVVSLADIGDGCPDLLCGKHARNLLLEVKNDKQPKSKQALTEAQIRFSGKWRGQWACVHSVEEAINYCEAKVNQWNSEQERR